MQEIKKSLKKNTVYLILSQPGVYLQSLLIKTIVIGICTLILGLIIKGLDFEAYTIPPTMHSLIGIVIGLLLVFRTNTAYDRWWDGRKVIGNLSTHVGLISARLSAIEYRNKNLFNTSQNFRDIISDFLIILSNYLTTGNDDEESTQFHISQKQSIQKALIEIQNFDETDENVSGIYNSLNTLLEYSNALERIKNTPIPLSYVLHIKMSIFIYMITLPFGMFHELGLWATPLVMLVYYIIAGVEIISNEIENPFANDPNDLPTSKLFSVMLETLNDNKK